MFGSTWELSTPLGSTARRRGWRHVLVALVTTEAALADGGSRMATRASEVEVKGVCKCTNEKKKGGVAMSEHTLSCGVPYGAQNSHPTVGAWGSGGQSAAPGLQKNRSEPTTT
jgi:hypothetical protein